MTPLAASATTGPVDPRRAALNDLVAELGPEVVRQATPDQLADAAFRLYQHRQQQLQPVAPTPLADTNTSVAQRPDVAGVNAAALRAPDPTGQRIKELGLQIAGMIGDGANLVRFALGSHPTTAETQSLAALGTMNRGGYAQFQAARAAATPDLPPAFKASVQRGAGVWASVGVGGAASELLPVVPGVINKATNLLLGNYAGAVAYQALTPTEAGETRAGHVFGAPAATMALAGAGMEAVGATVTRDLKWSDVFAAKVPGLDRYHLPFFGPRSTVEAVAEGGQLARDVAQATTTPRPPPSTAFQKAPDALQGLTDAQLAAQPLGQTPPLAASRAAPGVQEAQIAQLAERRVAEHPVDIERRRGMSPQTVQQAMQQAAIDVAVAHTPTIALASPDLQAAVGDLATHPPTPTLATLAQEAFQQANPDAHFAAHVGDHIAIPPATQVGGALTDDLVPGALPSLNIAQSLQFVARSQDQLDQIVAAARSGGAPLGQPGPLSARGAQAGFVLRPAATALTGFGLSTLGDITEDKSPGAGSLLHAVGRLMMTAAVIQAPAEFLARRAWAKNIIGALDATVALSEPGTREAVAQIGRMLNYSATDAAMMEDRLTKTFGGRGSPADRAFAYIGGPKWNQSAHWESLTPAQQQAAEGMLRFNDDLGRVAKAAGVLQQSREHYMRVSFNKRWYDTEWAGDNATAVRHLSQTGSWAQHGTFPDLGTAEQWLQTFRPGVDPEKALNHSGIDLSVGHYRSVMQAIHNKALTDALQSLNVLQPKEVLFGGSAGRPGTTQLTPNPAGWRDVHVPGWENFRAPEAVATVMENMARGPLNTWQIGRTYDLLAGLATKFVVYNRWIHGVNLFRRALNAGIGPDAYWQAQQAYVANDPSILEWAGHGLQVKRGSTVPLAAQAVDDWLAEGGHSALTTAALTKARGFLGSGDKLQDMIGTFGLAVANTERAAFMERHPSVLPGSAEWATNMQRIADYANDVAGRVPQWFRSQAAQKTMSRALLAPHFLETRWNLMRHGLIDDPAAVAQMLASGHEGQVATLNGGLAPGDALYGKFKMRQLLYVLGFSAGLSYLLTGKPPVLNPQTGKYYAQTPLKDGHGNTIGIDLSGEDQAEGQLFGSPDNWTWALSYLKRHVNPAINIGSQLYQGRDYEGHQLSAAENIENAASNLGGLAQGAEFGLRTGVGLTQGQVPTVGEGLRAGASAFGLSGFSTMGGSSLTTAAVAALRRAGITNPTTEQVWNLTRMMMSDYRRTGRAYGYVSDSYVNSEVRLLQRKFPASWLWDGLKRSVGRLLTTPTNPEQ